MVRNLAAPMRDAAYRVELGERVCLQLMDKEDWQMLLKIWVSQKEKVGS